VNSWTTYWLALHQVSFSEMQDGVLWQSMWMLLPQPLRAEARFNATEFADSLVQYYNLLA
jgi:hypothetical protein